MAAQTDRFYLKHLVELSVTEAVIASDDIIDDGGVKLVAKGAALTGELLGEVVRHGLVKPIDTSITIADSVTASGLQAHAQKLMAASQGFSRLLQAVRGHNAAIDYLSRLPINQALANKLTVMQRQLPVCYEHSLKVAIACVSLGMLCRLSMGELEQLAAIGIYHDLGQLHIDPLVLNPQHKFGRAEWRQIHLHPVIGCMLLKDVPGFHPGVSVPVLEHHERMDGSGYPKGLTGERISRLGRIVAVAEVMVGVCQKDSCGHLDTIMKANMERLDPQVVHLLARAMVGVQFDATRMMPDVAGAQRMFDTLTQVFIAWQEVAAMVAVQPCPQALEQLAARMTLVRQSLARAGIQLGAGEQLLAELGDDDAALGETVSVLRETLFQLGHVVNEINRRHADYEDLAPKTAAEAFDNWLGQTEQRLANV